MRPANWTLKPDRCQETAHRRMAPTAMRNMLLPIYILDQTSGLFGLAIILAMAQGRAAGTLRASLADEPREMNRER